MLFKFALLLAGAMRSLAEASIPQPGSLLEGLCQDSADASLEMLQKRMERAQPTTLDTSADGASMPGSVTLAQHSSNSSDGANATALLATNATTGDLPFGIGDIVKKAKKALPDTVSDAVSNVLSGAAVDAFVALLNSTLQMLQVQADGFLTHCEEYKDSLLGNVSVGSDQAIAALQAAVAANVEPVQQFWAKIADAIVEVLPPISAALEAIGQEDIAGRLVTVVGKATSAVGEVLGNATSIIAKVGNATQAEKDAALVELNATIENGLAAVTSFETGLVEVLQGAIDRLAHKLGIAMVATAQAAQPELQTKLEALEAQIADWVKTLADALQTVFTSTLESTEVALSPPSKGGAAMRTSVGLLLATVWAAAVF